MLGRPGFFGPAKGRHEGTRANTSKNGLARCDLRPTTNAGPLRPTLRLSPCQCNESGGWEANLQVPKRAVSGVVWVKATSYYLYSLRGGAWRWSWPWTPSTASTHPVRVWSGTGILLETLRPTCFTLSSCHAKCHDRGESPSLAFQGYWGVQQCYRLVWWEAG
jgi:hypothetical protein